MHRRAAKPRRRRRRGGRRRGRLVTSRAVAGGAATRIKTTRCSQGKPKQNSPSGRKRSAWRTGARRKNEDQRVTDRCPNGVAGLPMPEHA